MQSQLLSGISVFIILLRIYCTEVGIIKFTIGMSAESIQEKSVVRLLQEVFPRDDAVAGDF